MFCLVSPRPHVFCAPPAPGQLRIGTPSIMSTASFKLKGRRLEQGHRRGSWPGSWAASWPGSAGQLTA